MMIIHSPKTGLAKHSAKIANTAISAVPFYLRLTMLAVLIGLHLPALAHQLDARPGLPQPAAPAVADTSYQHQPLPLKPGRRLQYTAEEGTWMSVDVSPDGRTLVFDLLGDLYLLPIRGGKATRITNGMALDAQPRFSPDGKTLVFTSDRGGSDNIWTLDLETPNAEPKPVTNDGNGYYISPEWTPDGGYIVASKRHHVRSRYSSRDLWLIPRDGGSGVQLTHSPENDEISVGGLTYTLGAALSPAPEQRNYIWYSQFVGPIFNTKLPRYQLYRYDRDSGAIQQMSSAYGAAMRPALSDDGNYLVYASRYDHQTGLRIRDLRSGDERWLAYPVQHDEQESYARLDTMPGYSFTPDSRHVVASYGGKIWNISVDDGEQTPIPFQANVDIGIGPEVRYDYNISDSDRFTATQIHHPVLSPDGKRLAFTALDRLYVMDYPNGRAVRLTDRKTGEFMPAWSPDGRWLAYSTWDEARGGHIYKIRSNGRGKPIKLTQRHGAFRSPVWSPDGKRIVAIKYPSREIRSMAATMYLGHLVGEFIYVDSKGGAAQHIASSDDVSNPHFTDDPNRIYASSRKDGLISFRWDGSDVKQHLRVVNHLIFYRPAPLITASRDGKRASVLYNNQLYTLKLPALTGKDAPVVDVVQTADASLAAEKITTIGAHYPRWHGDHLTWSIGNAFLTRGQQHSADATERRIEVPVIRDTPRGKVLLKGARLITLNGDEVIEQGEMLIENNRIVKVAQRGQIAAPPGTTVIDVSGKTIVPGFVDTHYHAFTLMGGLNATELHSRQNWQYLTMLAYGVTTLRDPQSGTTDILTYADRVRAGDMVGPRIYSTGPGVFWTDPINSYQDALNILKRYKDYYHTNTFKMYLSGQRRQRQWLIMAARELQLMPTAEAGLNYPLNLTHAMDGYSGLEHLLHTYPVYRDVRQLFVKSGITYSPTMVIEYGAPGAQDYFHASENALDNPKLRNFTPMEEMMVETSRRGFWGHKSEYMFPRHAEFVNELIQAGGRAAVGSHGELQGLGYHWEIWAMQSGGLSPHNALKAAARYGAEAIGLGNHLGSLEAGKLADLLILDKNPLDDIRNTTSIDRVMKNGRLYDGDTLDEVWPQQNQLPSPYWRTNGPHATAGAGKAVSLK